MKGVFSDTDEAYMLFLGQQLFLHSLYLVFTCKIISLNLSISTFQAGKFQSVFELSELYHGENKLQFCQLYHGENKLQFCQLYHGESYVISW